MKILRLTPTLLAYFCLATVLAQAAGLAVLWSKGSLDKQRLVRMLAVAHGLDLQTMREEFAEANPSPEAEQAALEDVIESRTLKSLDLDLREAALSKGLAELLNLETKLQSDQERYRQLKQSFDDLLADLEGKTSDSALLEVRRTLEAMQPKQAKDQILKMLEDNAMDDVVAIMKEMQIDKRKKIAGEFKTGDEPDKLHEILTQIRLGNPEVALIRNTRKQLNAFDTAQP
jgi:hypothetical protein